MIFNIKGAMVAIVTPMTTDGNIDFAALKKLVNIHIKANTAAIVATGTTGESATLTNDEHLMVIEKIIEFAAGKIIVIAGTGANSTTEAIYLTAAAKKLGADAVLLVTPYYNKPTQHGLYLHYKEIANTVDIPQILYNVPGRTAVNMSVDTVIKLAKIDNIVGIKDATGDLTVAQELISKCDNDFLLYSGDDITAVDFILIGGDGGISVTSNICPNEISIMYNLALQRQEEKARVIDNNLAELHKNLFIESNPIPVKWVLYKMGLCNLGIRLPLTVLSDNAQKILTSTLKKIKIIND